MGNKFKILLIGIILCVMYGGCGRDGGNDDKSVLFSIEKNILYEERNTAQEVCKIKTGNGKIIYDVASALQETFYIQDNNDDFASAVIYTIDTDMEDLIDFDFDKNGNIFYITLTIENEKGIIDLRKCGITGETEEIKVLNFFWAGKEDNCYDWKLEVLSNGNILIYSHWGYLLLNEHGEVIEKETLENAEIYEIMVGENNCMFVQQYRDGEKVISQIDLETGQMEQMPDISNFVKFDFATRSEDEVYMYSDTSVYSYSFLTKKRDKLFDWSDYGIVGDYVIKIYSQDGQLHCVIYENQILYDVKWLGSKSKEVRTELVLGCIGEQSEVRRAVAKFNNENTEYRIKVVDYMQGEEITAVNNLYNDILSGKGVDLIKFDSQYIDDRFLGEKGVLEDLNPYLEQSRELNREDLVDSVYQSLLFNNKLYMLPTNFLLETMITKRKWAGENDKYSVENFLEILDADSTMYELYISRDAMIQGYSSYAVNMTDNKNLNRDTLKKYLKLIKYMPESIIFEPNPQSRKEGRVLLEQCIIDCVNTYMYKKSVWGEDYAFVNFSEMEGNGIMFIPMNCYGIIAASEQKEGAWQFIESFFSEEWQDSITPNYNFSVCKEKLASQFKEAMVINHYFNEEGEEKEAPILTYDAAGDRIEVFAAREQDIKELEKAVNQAQLVKRNVSAVENIIREEAEAYFCGDKTLDAVADAIENRLKSVFAE